MDQVAYQSLTSDYGEQIADPWWRLCNLYTIITDDSIKIPFRPNDEQRALFHNLWTRNLLLKARQLGFTTEICLFALDQAIFNEHFAAGVIAHKLPDAEKIFQNKIILPYRELPEAIRRMAPVEKQNESTLRLANGSSITVSTSARSGTLQLLHVSEFGKICAQRPQAAREIVTGAFEAVSADQMIIVESTAEGAEGYFHDDCIAALKRQQEGRKGTKLDWRLHFFAWWTQDKYELDPEGIVISDEMSHYFDTLAAEHNITLSARQRAWYVKKAESLRGDMQREYPSFPAEAFAQSIAGAIYGKEMTALRTQRRITDVPHEASIPVNTFWDMGVNDTNAIWFHQQVGPRHHFLKYIEASGEGLAYYWRRLQEIYSEHGWVYGEHYLPHDADYRIQGEEVETKKDILEKLGMRSIRIVPRVQSITTGIDLTRSAMSSVWIDRAGCHDGIAALDNYQRKWDVNLGRFLSKPLHNWASNGADAFRQWAQGYHGQAEGRHATMQNPIFTDPRFTGAYRPATRAGY